MYLPFVLSQTEQWSSVTTTPIVPAEAALGDGETALGL